MPYGVENIVRKEEIACYKQFLLFMQCFSTAIYQNMALCGNGLNPTFKHLLTAVKLLSCFQQMVFCKAKKLLALDNDFCEQMPADIQSM